MFFLLDHPFKPNYPFFCYYTIISPLNTSSPDFGNRLCAFVRFLVVWFIYPLREPKCLYNDWSRLKKKSYVWGWQKKGKKNIWINGDRSWEKNTIVSVAILVNKSSKIEKTLWLIWCARCESLIFGLWLLFQSPNLVT